MLSDYLPYILSHRNKTFVFLLTDDLLAKKQTMKAITKQISLLHSLNIKLILVAGTHGISSQINQRQAKTINRKNALIRCDLECLFSTSMPKSIASNHKIRLMSGNLATARPIGVVRGVDYGLAGVVRNIDTEIVTQLLDKHTIVLFTSTLYSAVGNHPIIVNWYDLALQLSIEMQADKLIVMHANSSINQNIQELSLGQLELNEAKINNADKNDYKTFLLNYAKEAIEKLIPRVHLLYGMQKDVITRELFSRDGVGLMLTKKPFEQIEPADSKDLGALLALIQPLEKQGILNNRQIDSLEQDIAKYYFVIKRDTDIVASGACIPYKKEKMGEIACLAVKKKDSGNGRGKAMLLHLEKTAKAKGIKTLFCLTTQTEHWFIEQGYTHTTIEVLPIAKQQQIDLKRHSRVLIKHLT